MSAAHRPVLLEEVLELLAPEEGGTYIDATAGLGGHSAGILNRIGPNGRVIGIDRDEDALTMAVERMQDPRFIARRGSFSSLAGIACSAGADHVDGVLFDLGVSMMQLRERDRGFSFLTDARLDMRMDARQPVSAWDVVNGYREADLLRILREFGEEPRAHRIARAIVEERRRKTIDTCEELGRIVERAAGRRSRIHPATRTFQAIRIEVNRELDELAQGLDEAVRILRPGGRVCVISYHSLEDRIVKHALREKARNGIVQILTKKPLVPGSEEVRSNPSARSAKLRGAVKS